MKTIRMTGEIYKTAAERLRQELADARGEDVVLEIDSRGGSFIAGLRMWMDLKDHKGGTTARVIHAGSAATLPMVACDEVIMTEGATVFMHLPTAAATRDIQLDIGELRDAIDNLERAAIILGGCYAQKAGGPIEKWRLIMKQNVTWSDTGAVNVGLADRVEGSPALCLSNKQGREERGMSWYQQRRGALARARSLGHPLD